MVAVGRATVFLALDVILMLGLLLHTQVMGNAFEINLNQELDKMNSLVYKAKAEAQKAKLAPLQSEANAAMKQEHSALAGDISAW